jgi:Bacterial PH domain
MLFEKIELEPSETVLKVVRKHWFVIVAELFGSFFLILAPLFLLLALVLFPQIIPFEFHLETHLPYVTFGVALWLLFSLLTGFMTWTHYYLDLWVITDRRIIVIDQIRFFNRKVSSFRLERLQDIKVSITGILPTFLNFGTMRAQTASAAESNFMSTGLPDPRGLQSIIQKAMDARLEALQGLPPVVISD